MPRIPENEKLTPQETARKRGFADGYRDRENGIKNYSENGMIITYELIHSTKKAGEYKEYYDAYDAGVNAAHAEWEQAAREEEYEESRTREIFWDEKPWEREIGAVF